METFSHKTEIFCNTCLSEEYLFLHPISDYILDIIKDCTSIQIEHDKFVQKFICTECSTLLNKFYNFKKKFLKIQLFLKNENTNHYQDNGTIDNYDEDKNIKLTDANIYLNNVDTNCIKNDIYENNDTNIIESYEQIKESDVESKCSDSLSNHSKKKKTENSSLKKYNCSQCSKSFNYKAALNRHLEKHKDSPVLSCPACQKSFYELSFILKHIKLKHEYLEPELKCQNCEEKFFIDKQLKRHNNRRHKESFCKICDKNQTDLRRHFRTAHNTSNLFPCNECDKSFKFKQSRERHYARKHQGLIRPKTVCNICGKKFAKIQAHIKSHGRDKKVTCRFCNGTFENMSQLRQHSKVQHVIDKQNEEYKQECDICHKRFINKSNLYSHKRFFHDSNRPHECQVCKKSFKRQYSLIEHTRMHTDERPYPCEMCDKKFRSSNSLNNHRRSHTGEKPFVCRICGRAFTQRISLRTHLRGVHKEPVIKKVPSVENYHINQSIQTSHSEILNQNISLDIQDISHSIV